MKRTTVRIISFFSAAIIVAVGFIFYENNMRKSNAEKLRYVYMRSLSTLCDSLYNIDTELNRSKYVTSPVQFGSLAAKIYKEAGTAESALSQLPNENTDLSAVYKFVSQVGDYSLSVAKSSIVNEVSEEERENLKLLGNTAQKLWNSVEEMRKRYEDGKKMYLDLNAGEITEFGEMGDIKESISDYPTLIYDGPYSDTLNDGVSQLLEESASADENTAKAKAAEVLGCKPEEVTRDEDGAGLPEYYRFYYKNGTVAVTKKGGYVLWYRKYKEVGSHTVSYTDAVKRAADWLKNLTGEDYEDSYYFTEEGVCTVNFAYKEGSTICYTDLVKVGVALDSGEIVLYDATGYIMNHKNRVIETPKLAVSEAQTKISKNLSVRDARRVLIPSYKDQEIPCYQFTCTDADGNEVLVYINSNTGYEEKVAVVVKLDGGTLTK